MKPIKIVRLKIKNSGRPSFIEKSCKSKVPENFIMEINHNNHHNESSVKQISSFCDHLPAINALPLKDLIKNKIDRKSVE